MAASNLKLCGNSDIADQLEDAYSEILEAGALVRVLRQSDGSGYEPEKSDLSMFCSVVSRMLRKAGNAVESSVQAIRKPGGAS